MNPCRNRVGWVERSETHAYCAMFTFPRAATYHPRGSRKTRPTLRLTNCRWIAVVLIAGALSSVAAAAETLSLEGLWSFHRDEQKVGVKDRWFAGVLPAPAGGPSKIHLPGSTDEAKAGIANSQKPTLDGLYRPNLYTGAAWYQREVEIPDAWKGKRVTLCFERVHWVTQVWLDGKPCGEKDSLISPHRRDLGTGLSPGKHSLTVCADNSLKIDLGPFVSILYEGTQTNWNGLIGRLELRATDPVAIDNIQVYPDVDHKRAAVRVRIANATGRAVSGQLELSATDRQSGTKTPLQSVPFSATGESQVVETDLPMGDDVRLWDEFSPALYRSERVAADGGLGRVRRPRAGNVRHAEVRRPGHAVHAQRPAAIVSAARWNAPSSRAPAIRRRDVPAWQRIYRMHEIVRPELHAVPLLVPAGGRLCRGRHRGRDAPGRRPAGQHPTAGDDPERDAFIEAEFLRMVRTYGNHPSFCLMTLGNEYGGEGRLAVTLGRDAHPRRPAAPLLVGLGRADDGQPPVHRGRPARHPRAGHRSRFPRRRRRRRTGR